MPPTCPQITPTLLLWRDVTSVVIGRNQNPWTECDVALLQARAVPLVRRYSGGGTVYHDLATSIFSIASARAGFRREAASECARAAVCRATRERSTGVDFFSDRLSVNSRFDLVLQNKAPEGAPDGNGEGDGSERAFKVSGSAFRIYADVACHHGTLLLDGADLKTLRQLLVGKPVRSSRAIGSVKSAVASIPGIAHDDFCKALCAEFSEIYGAGTRIPKSGSDIEFLSTDADLESLGQQACDDIEKTEAQLKSVEWILGQTPEFENRLAVPEFGIELDVKVVDGKFKAASCKILNNNNNRGFDLDIEFLGYFTEHLLGNYYSSEGFENAWFKMQTNPLLSSKATPRNKHIVNYFKTLL